MTIGEKIKSWFAGEKDLPDTGAKPMLGEIGYADSILYTAKDFPKYNPDVLMQKKGRGIYKKMMLDDQVKAVLSFKRVAVISRKWYFCFWPGTFNNNDHPFI